MHRVHPQVNSFFFPCESIDDKFCSASTTTFTVWKKSLLLNGKGFTVFNSAGNLVFRVDKYALDTNKEIVLMDHAGKVLITMRRKTFSLQNRWEAFKGEPSLSEKPIFAITKPSSFSNKTRNRNSAHVFVNASKQSKQWDYQIEGSLCKPSCKISSAFGDSIAQVKRKEAKANVMLGDDVFSLVVQPGVDQAFVMGVLIIFNEMS